jgi:hypothetical protein
MAESAAERTVPAHTDTLVQAGTARTYRNAGDGPLVLLIMELAAA